MSPDRLDAMEERLRQLETLVGAQRFGQDEYPSRSRAVDEQLVRSIDQMGRVQDVVPFAMFDEFGAAAARAPADAQYLVAAANSVLSAERVATDTASVTWDFGTAAQAKAVRAALTGDVTASAGSNATTIANSVVTFAKMADLADQRLIGNVSGGVTAPAALTQAMVRTFLGLGTAAFTASTDYDASGAAAAVLAKAVTQCQWSIIGSFAGATTYYAAPGGGLVIVEYQWRVTRACTLQNMYLLLDAAPGAGNTVAVTMRKNGSDNAVTATIADAATTAEDATHAVALAAGDRVSCKAVTSLLNSGSNLTMTFELLPT